MLTVNGFCCTLVDAIKHTEEISVTNHQVCESEAFNLMSTSIAGEPCKVDPQKKFVAGLYIGRTSPIHNIKSKQLSGLKDDSDFLVYVFLNGVALLNPVTLSSLRQRPVILPTKTPYYPPLTLTELEIIIVTPFTPPKPLMGAADLVQTKHVAHFQFICFPTQTLDLRGIALLPETFWMQERVVSQDWAPLCRNHPDYHDQK